MSKTCPICNTLHAGDGVLSGENYFYNCPKCGNFKISFDAIDIIKAKSPIQKLSSWISERNKVFNDPCPNIDSEKLDLILKQRDKSISEKFNAMILALSKFGSSLKESVILLDRLNECYIEDESELRSLIKKAKKDKLINIDKATNKIFKSFTFEGKEYLESLNTPNKNSNKIFMAFWFNEELKIVFDDVVIPKINKTEFLAERVSSKTTANDQYISDDIIAKIKSSRALVADCTGNRTAIYYEAGFAMGMKIPVIWTCKNGIDENDTENKTHMEKRCFDINQYPCIVWEDAEDLSKQLIDRLRRDL